ncbi:carboxyl transferase domain-containing protein [Streptomyces mirabilis]|uniref:carboxyl transferase domain-containing protein n=1 Tax=Streptomyces mirabilis TaxID=68239 RepID=UPI0022596FCA|nr:carboxyl transferase domain-containing protein [Streptomyces mirabilis]MCX4433655.1 acetyl-CoA carboxylase carboxyl transferase subunit alpha/beta [Streptomyces mirabilis]
MTERFSAREAIALAGDDFRELPVPMREFKPDGPLSWQGYDDSRRRALARTGEDESVVCGTAVIGSTRVVLIAFEFGFLGGSLGERTGDRVEAAYTHARAHRLPVVSLVATGGSRMQEGMLALTQLQRVARQSALAREAGLPQIAVLRDPTTGGGWATLGAGADVTLALPGAQVGFAGSRVRPPDADPAAYTAEAQVTAGAVDAVVREEELRETLTLWLTLLTAPTPDPGAEAAPGAKPGPETGAGPQAGAKAEPKAGTEPQAEAKAGTGPQARTGQEAEPGPQAGARPEAKPRPEAEAEPESEAGAKPEAGAGAKPRPEVEPVPPPAALGAHDLPATGWDAVRRARSPERPRAAAYLDAYFTRRAAISGDRCGGSDDGMLCGFGSGPAGRTVAYAAQCGSATRPAGYRTAARLIRLAGRLGFPVLTLVDTPGAANDAQAERQGAGSAIADLFAAVATARTPVTTLVIGEGGSGGALALAAPGNTWATPDSYFSVIAPELAAAILKRPASEVHDTADQLRIRPQDLVELGVIRGIVEHAER